MVGSNGAQAVVNERPLEAVPVGRKRAATAGSFGRNQYILQPKVYLGSWAETAIRAVRGWPPPTGVA